MYPNARQALAGAAQHLADRLADAFFGQYYGRVRGSPEAGLARLMGAWQRVAASMQFHVAATFSLFQVVGTAYKGLGGFTYARIRWMPTHASGTPVEFIARFRTDADLDTSGFHVYARWDAASGRWVSNLVGSGGTALSVEAAWANIVAGSNVLVGAVGGVPTLVQFGGATQLVLVDLADPPSPLPSGYPW
jgi:hypothetical protein